MTFVSAMVASVPTDRKDEYIKFSTIAGEVFKSHGALTYTEAWGVDVPDGKKTSFPLAVQRQEGETVVFSWMTWPTKEAQEKGSQAAMSDERFANFNEMVSGIIDGSRMIFGTFEAIVEL